MRQCKTSLLIADANDPVCRQGEQEAPLFVNPALQRHQHRLGPSYRSLEGPSGKMRGVRERGTRGNGTAFPGLTGSSQQIAGRNPPLQGYTCLQAVSLFTEAGSSRHGLRRCSDFHTVLRRRPERRLTRQHPASPDAERGTAGASALRTHRDSSSGASLTPGLGARVARSRSSSGRGIKRRRREAARQPRVCFTHSLLFYRRLKSSQERARRV